MAGVEVLQRRQFQPLLIDRLPQGAQLIVSPVCAAAGLAQYSVAAGRRQLARPKIIREVRHDMRSARLLGEAVVLAIQHMAIKAKS